MTVKEMKDWLSQYPDDALVESYVTARNGRGGTFEEELLFAGSHLEEKDGMKIVYMSYGFEIGWRNRHPEFQPPEDPGTDVNELRADILAILSGAIDRSVTEDTAFKACGLDPDDCAALFREVQELFVEGATSYTPDTVDGLLAFGTFGNLLDFMIDGTRPD